MKNKIKMLRKRPSGKDGVFLDLQRMIRASPEPVEDGEYAVLVLRKWVKGELTTQREVGRVKWPSPAEFAALRVAAQGADLLRMLKRVLAMHECGNNGMYNGEAILSGSVADEIRAAIAKAQEPKP